MITVSNNNRILDNFKRSHGQVVSPRNAYNHYKRGCKLFDYSTGTGQLFNSTFRRLMAVGEYRQLSGPEGNNKYFWANVPNRVVRPRIDSYFVLHDFQDDFEYPYYCSVAQKRNIISLDDLLSLLLFTFFV